MLDKNIVDRNQLPQIKRILQSEKSLIIETYILQLMESKIIHVHYVNEVYYQKEKKIKLIFLTKILKTHNR